MKLSELKIRDKISCRISGGSGNVYHLRVEGTIANKYLLTDLPIVSARKISFKIGSVFDFLYIEDTGIYFFEGEIVEDKDPNIMRVLIQEVEFNQIQRRTFFRLHLDMKCGILSFKDFFKENLSYNSVSVDDLSAQSIKVVSFSKIDYSLGDLLYVRTDFFSSFNGGLWGEIYKISESEEEDSTYKQTFIIKFILLSNLEIENIVKLIFKKQREILKSNYEK